MTKLTAFKNKAVSFLRAHYQVIVIMIVLIAAVVPFAVNMLHYPYLENDEGTYMAQAWAIATKGRLSHYTYWYDHAPVGWILIALWTYVTGGFFTFGVTELSGRIFMLVLHIANALLVYFIGKRMTKSVLGGLLASLIFCLTPLGIYFERRVLLDNIMTFWLLVSLFFIIRTQPKLRHIVASAAAFAIAVLTKENAIFAFPGLLYGVIAQTSKAIRRFAVSIWLVIAGSLSSLYVLYALIKNELFPAKNGEHVSLISTLQFQSSRGNGLPFWKTGSDFYQNLSEWILRDRYMVYIGFLALVVCIILSVRDKMVRILTLITTFSLLFIMRGGLVINFYIIPFIPLLALHIAVVVNYAITIAIKRMNWRTVARGVAVAASVLLFVSLPSFKDLYAYDEVTPQIEAIQWIKDNLQESDEIIIDGYAYTDLQGTYYNGRQFRNADWFLKVTEDPEVRTKKLGDDWHSMDYIMMTHEMAWQLKYANHPLVQDALTHAVPIQVFSHVQSEDAWRDPQQFAIDHADAVIVLKVHNDTEITL